MRIVRASTCPSLWGVFPCLLIAEQHTLLVPALDACEISFDLLKLKLRFSKVGLDVLSDICLTLVVHFLIDHVIKLEVDIFEDALDLPKQRPAFRNDVFRYRRGEFRVHGSEGGAVVFDPQVCVECGERPRLDSGSSKKSASQRVDGREYSTNRDPLGIAHRAPASLA